MLRNSPGVLLVASLLALGCRSKSADEPPPPLPRAAPEPPKPVSPTLLARLPTDDSGSGPHDIAVDSTNVYVTWQDWKNEKDDLPAKIIQIPLAGGPPKELATRQHGGQSIVATNNGLFWLVAGPESAVTKGSVMRILLKGGRPTSVAKAFVASDAALVADEENLYFGDYGSANEAQLFKMPISGGKRQVLVPKTDDSIVTLAVDKANAYWVTIKAIMKVPLSGGAAVELVKEKVSKSDVWGLASDGTHLYWTDRNNDGLANHQPDENQFPSAVRRVPVSGGPVETVADHLRYRPFGIAVDSTNVYWVINADHRGAIMRTSKSGGTPTILVDGQRSPAYLALDANYVYWCNIGDGLVARIPK